ncbi:craniofacial development protein 2 [Tanacetum coccineum]
MSSAEAEYVALSASCAQVMWMRTQLQDYGFNYKKYVVENGIIELYFVRTEYQLADMFTKALPEDRFKYLVRRIGMRCLTPAELEVGAGEYRGTRRDSRLASSRRIRVGSWNVGTLTGKFLELVDALKRKKVDIACFQETKWKGLHTREGNQYKLWYSGSTIARNGVGVILALNLDDKVVQVTNISNRIMMVRLVIQEETVSVISTYTPHVGIGEAKKMSFWDSLDDLVRECSTNQQQLIIAGDLNGHRSRR